MEQAARPLTPVSRGRQTTNAFVVKMPRAWWGQSGGERSGSGRRWQVRGDDGQRRLRGAEGDTRARPQRAPPGLPTASAPRTNSLGPDGSCPRAWTRHVTAWASGPFAGSSVFVTGCGMVRGGLCLSPLTRASCPCPTPAKPKGSCAWTQPWTPCPRPALASPGPPLWPPRLRRHGALRVVGFGKNHPPPSAPRAVRPQGADDTPSRTVWQERCGQKLQTCFRPRSPKGTESQPSSQSKEPASLSTGTPPATGRAPSLSSPGWEEVGQPQQPPV